ncbi:protein TolA [Massilia sp. WF1]|uniref:cell envelope integrity protein TolA n=1 Tax=unclassified Massilia TaxID=2609279 RepID=UPI00064B753C|nr:MULTISPECIES: cell envelope integrity protein TolA [unclassified Massilia]ALK96452.1 protein TolA [Massilia sp. WG5]KLU37885.1 protein TolA [Massilia sp. WF1]
MSATKNNSNGMDGTRYRVPPEPNRWPAIGLAVGVHALLLAFLVIGINWTNNQPVAVEAEVWDTTVQTAAPPAPTPPPAPEPEPQPQPETPPPTPRVAEPPPPVEQPAPPKQPDIALERERKRKEELKRKEEQRIEHEQELAQQRAQEKKDKALADKKAREEQAREEKAREEAEKKELAKKEELEKKKAEKEKAAKEKAEKLAKEKAEKEKADKLAKQSRDQEMKRLMSGAGNPSSSGSAEKSTAPRIDKGYAASIAAKIKGNTTYPGSTDVPGNPEVVFQVEQLPTGEILSVRKTKSSGIPAFDDAVERGINKSSPLPKKKDGTVERSLPVSFKLKDLN